VRRKKLVSPILFASFVTMAFIITIVFWRYLNPQAAEIAEGSPITAIGTLIVVPNETNSDTPYFFFETDDATRYALNVSGDTSLLFPGERLTVMGVLSDDTIHVTQLVPDESVAAESTASTSRSTGEKKVAIVISEFDDTPQENDPDTVKQGVQNLLTGETNSVASYYTEASYNKLHFTGDVYGVYRLPKANSGCSYATKWTGAAQLAARAAGVSLSQYDHILYVFEHRPECNFDSFGEYYSKNAWVNGYNVDELTLNKLVHEIGHNLGLNHAATIQCKNSTGDKIAIGGGFCTSDEYGDPYDTMALARTPHFNASEKERLGWFDDTNTTVVSQNGIYTLHAFEETRNDTQVIKILRPGIPLKPYNGRVPSTADGYYYLEYRRPIGYDSTFNPKSPVVNGVSIRLAMSHRSNTPEKSYLIDAFPEIHAIGDRLNLPTPRDLEYYDAALEANKTFTDPDTGLSITVLEVTDSEAKVQINLAEQTVSTPPPSLITKPPIGYLEGIDRDGTVLGWALDPDAPEKNIRVMFYLDGPKNPERLIGSVVANQPSEDVTNVTGYAGNHRYTFDIPAISLDGKPHTIYAYGVDVLGEANSVSQLTIISNTFTLSNLPPASGPTPTETASTAGEKPTSSPTPETSKPQPAGGPTPTPQPFCRFFIALCRRISVTPVTTATPKPPITAQPIATNRLPAPVKLTPTPVITPTPRPIISCRRIFLIFRVCK
jgi:hypothetical protein